MLFQQKHVKHKYFRKWWSRMKLWKQQELTAYDTKVKYSVSAYVIHQIPLCSLARAHSISCSPCHQPHLPSHRKQFFKACKTSWKSTTSHLATSNYLLCHARYAKLTTCCCCWAGIAPSPAAPRPPTYGHPRAELPGLYWGEVISYWSSFWKNSLERCKTWYFLNTYRVQVFPNSVLPPPGYTPTTHANGNKLFLSEASEQSGPSGVENHCPRHARVCHKSTSCWCPTIERCTRHRTAETSKQHFTQHGNLLLGSHQDFFLGTNTDQSKLTE